MGEVYISENAYKEVADYIASRGYAVKTVNRDPRLGELTGDHPDLRMAKLGALPESPVYFASEEDFRPEYPENAAMCALCVAGSIIHRADITAPGLKKAAKTAGLREVNVRQGYAKCAAVAVDDKAIITADEGIARAAEACGVTVLRVNPGGVTLPGYREGFIGGASGRVGEEIIFNGSLENHPDAEKIKKFITSRGLKIMDFPNHPLRDIGSIIEV